MHTHHTIKVEDKGWRGNWFVKNILAELPIVGAYFHTQNIPHALHHAGKSAAMLVGGMAGMVIEGANADSTHNTTGGSHRLAKATASMALGMSLGNMAYNTLYSAGSTAYYHYHKTKKRNDLVSYDREMDASDLSMIDVSSKRTQISPRV